MKKTGVILLSIVLIIAVLTGCAKTNEPTTLRVCEVTHSIFYAPQYVAIEKGFFEEEGLKIELTNGQGADKVMSAIVSDSADIGFAGPEACIYVYNEGQEDHAKIFAQVTNCDGSFVMSRNDEKDFSWKNLKGKHILPGRKGGVPYMSFEYALRKNGMDPKTDANLDTSVQFALMAGAFAGGTGDYVTVFEPTASIMESEGKGFIVASVGEETGEMPYTAYFAKQSYIEKNKQTVEKFVRALYKAQLWVQENTPEEIAKAVVKQFPDGDEKILAKAIERYKEIGAYSVTPVMTEESLTLLQKVMQDAGELSKNAPFEKIVDNSFAEKAVK